MFGVRFDLGPDTKQVLTQNLPDVIFAVVPFQQSLDQVRIGGYILQTNRQRIANAIVIRTDANVVNTDQCNDVIEVIERFPERGVRVGAVVPGIEIVESCLKLVVLFEFAVFDIGIVGGHSAQRVLVRFPGDEC